MRKGERNKGTRLTRRIFQYLMGVTLLSVVSLGFFWIEGKVSRYNKEVALLKQTYSETKKQEVKNKILEIKDYIQWVEHSSKRPIAHTLETQVDQINLSGIKAGTEIDLAQANKDSICKSHVPVYVLDRKGSIVFAYNPFSESGSNRLNEDEKILLNQVRKSNNEDKGSLTLYKHTGTGDSVLIAAGYFNGKILPGFKVTSLVRSEYLDNVLQVHLLDSISKLRFAENEYVFINAMNGKALVTHGKYNNPPKDILSIGDTAWVSIFRAQQSSALHPEGVFHKYTWALLVRPGSSGKTSYFSYIPTLDWIIGMGFYEEDVKIEIELRKKELYADLQKTILNIIFYLCISTLLCYLLVWLFSKQFGKNIELFKVFFEKAAKEDHLIDKSKISYLEFLFMADAANLMVEERKLIEEALKESEAHYRYLFEQNPVPLMVYEIGSLKILSVNDAFIDHYGYTKAEALKMKLTDLYPVDEKTSVADLTENLNGLTYNGEWHHVKKDGTQITVEVDSHGFRHEGLSSRIVVINDISARKKIEDEIRILNANLELKVEERTALLESANKDLEAFSYSISHDLRAPLRHVNGFLELLTKHSYQKLDEKGRHYVESVSAASKHLGVLIDDLLNFSRTGRLEVKKDKIDMNVAFRDALNILVEETNGRTIEWKRDNMPTVYADYAMIRQVWVNLLGNAIKYTKKRDVAVIEVGSISGDDEYIFFVRDNGAGFDMSYAQKLFGVFQRLHTREEFEGTGIGLANVRQVIRRHNGRTWAEGEVDKGATFYFSLPKI